MPRDRDNHVIRISAFVAVLAAATIVLSMQVPASESTVLSLMSGARFVVAVAAVILGFISWFERRFPLDDVTIDLRSETAEVEMLTTRSI